MARYRQDLQLWDLTDPAAYLSRAQARAAAQPLATGGYLGLGVGITPEHEAVKAVVAEAVAPSDNSMVAALHLFEWMANHLEYDEARLEQSGLLEPAETLAAGGGVCRDLAGLYVSRLRAAGVPARLVAGYLAGNVGGFHAWVEVYVGGSGPSAWMPVDVSPIDGPYGKTMLLQAFGVQLPGHLPLRAVTEAQEQLNWSEAVSFEYSYRGDEPQVELAKQLKPVFETKRFLCINEATLARQVRTQHIGTCFADFVVATEVVLDYGVIVLEPGSSSSVTGHLAYPMASAGAETLYYGATFQKDPATGLATATKTY